MRKSCFLLIAFALLFLGASQSRGSNAPLGSSLDGCCEGLSSSSLSMYSIQTIEGDYVAAGTGMRNRGFGTITISGVPSGASIVEALLYWVVLDNSEGTSFKNGTFAGNSITGTRIGSGPDPCWGLAKHYAYRADVTCFVTGNGSYALTGFSSGTTNGQDPWNVGGSAPLSEGASLLVVWTKSGSTRKTVVIRDGSINLIATSHTDVITGFTAAAPVSAKWTHIGADGQVTGECDKSEFNTLAFNNDWNGSDPQSGADFSGKNLWDTDTYNVSSVVSSGATSATTKVSSIYCPSADCIEWVANVFSVTTNSPINFTCACDVTPPVITCPANASLNADVNCQATYTSPSATATDNCDPNPSVTSNPPLPVTFTGAGNHTITWTATDASNNTSSCTQTITVQDVTPPAISCPANATPDANDDCEATYGGPSATATDDCDISPTVTSDPDLSDPLGLGEHTITWTATDASNNASSCTQTITVQDVTPPAITCPGNVTVYPGADCEAEVELTATATDNCDDDPEITSDAPEENVYPIGETTITFTATDDAQNSSSCQTTVMVLALVDIKPGSCPNPLNTKSKGVLPVAILGCEGFDVDDIDPGSILLVGVAPIRYAVEDVATLMEDEPCECTNAGTDGFDDLTLKFDTQEIVDALGDVSDGEEVVLTLEGELTGGAAIEGKDCVVIRKKGKGGSGLVGLGSSTPKAFALFQNNPNPFARKTSISYTLPVSGHTTLKIYDTSGRLVTTLVDAEMNAGIYSTTWNRKNAASGVYFYKLTSGANSLTKAMTVLR